MNLIWDMRDQEEEELEKQINENKQIKEKKDKDIGKRDTVKKAPHQMMI